MPGQQAPVTISMQPVPPPQPPLPVRWSEALGNLAEAQGTLDSLAQQLDGAMYLDAEAWQQAVPHAQFTAALQGQHRKIAELEQALAALAARLEASERARAAAEARAVELSGEVEASASVFKLHWEELMRKDREISDLQAVVQALSLGGGGGAHSGGGGSDGGSSDGEPS